MKTKSLLGIALLTLGGVIGVTMMSTQDNLLNNTVYATMHNDGVVYDCAGLQFGTAFNSAGYGSGNDDIPDALDKDEDVVTLGTLSYINSNCKDNLPFKLGGTHNSTASKDKDAGSLTISLEDYQCDKVIIYAAAWANGKEKNVELVVGDTHQNLPLISSASNFDENTSYNCYTFTFPKTNTIIITNGDNQTYNHRVLISKIVFRLY